MLCHHQWHSSCCSVINTLHLLCWQASASYGSQQMWELVSDNLHRLRTAVGSAAPPSYMHVGWMQIWHCGVAPYGKWAYRHHSLQGMRLLPCMCTDLKGTNLVPSQT